MIRSDFHTHTYFCDGHNAPEEMVLAAIARISNGDMRRALDAYEFEVYFQPQYNIQSDPPKLACAEALIRWNHPELGMIPPNDGGIGAGQALAAMHHLNKLNHHSSTSHSSIPFKGDGLCV